MNYLAIGVVLAAPIVVTALLILADGLHDTLRHVRAARGDDPMDEACALTRPDPTPLVADFLLWQQELENTL